MKLARIATLFIGALFATTFTISAYAQSAAPATKTEIRSGVTMIEIDPRKGMIREFKGTADPNQNDISVTLDEDSNAAVKNGLREMRDIIQDVIGTEPRATNEGKKIGHELRDLADDARGFLRRHLK